MSIPLTSTRYLLSTDDLLGGWDQKSWIEVADDRQMPDTSVSSFQELADAATSGGVGSDAAKVRDQVIAVLSKDAATSEQWVESFCLGIYILPLSPLDGIAKDLMVDYMVHRCKIRHGMYRNGGSQTEQETALTNRGKYIRTEMNRLTSVRPGVGLGLNESVAAFGADSRRNGDLSLISDPTLAGGPFNGPRWPR